MARTKASVGAKLTSGKSSKATKTCSAPRAAPGTPSTSKGSTASGNPYHPRPTPKWQKPITNFFKEPADNSDEDEIASGSKKKRQRQCQQITSDTESEVEDNLDASNVSNDYLPPLSPDDNCHKIVEYFDKVRESHSGKGKGKGKGKGWIDKNEKVDDKENTSVNNEMLNVKAKGTIEGKSGKRDPDIVEAAERAAKRVKVDS